MRKYKKPVLNVEQFTANEFISTCSDTEEKYYVFKCSAGVSDRYGNVYLETNGKDGLQRSPSLDGWDWVSADKYATGSYHPYGEEHFVKVGETFAQGYYVNPSNNKVTNVLTWYSNSTGYHCTTALKENIKITQGNKS